MKMSKFCRSILGGKWPVAGRIGQVVAIHRVII